MRITPIKKIMIISGACSSAVSRWRKQYLAELGGQTPESGKQRLGI
ncbi:hypothetical protein [Isorropodon fossajaponicum symbiont]